MQGNNAKYWVDALAYALDALITVAVLLRLIARRRSKATFAVDDVFIILSVFPFYGMTVLGHIMGYQAGLGMPIATLTPSQLRLFMKTVMAGIVTYSLAVTMVKISILTLYRRIFDTARFHQASLVLGVVCVTWFFVICFTDIFQCRPFEAAFDPQLVFTYHCIDIQSYLWGVVLSNLVIDLAILYLPLPMVWKLQLSIRQKLALTGMFLLGLFACIAGVVRMTQITNIKTSDLTLTFASAYMWSQIEPAVAIICACLMTYRPLFIGLDSKFLKITSIFTRSSQSSASNEGSGEELMDKEFWRRHSEAVRMAYSEDGKHTQNLQTRGAGYV